MNTKTLEYCVDIAHMKSFTKAAEKNFISQQALSQQIKALEKDLGFKIFERTSRSVNVSMSGELFIKEAEKALEHLSTGIRNAQQKNMGYGEPLVIGYNGPTSQHNLSKVVGRFLKDYPMSDIRLKLGTYPEIVSAFTEQHAYDLIEVGDFEEFDTDVYRVMQCKAGYIYAVFNKNHPLAKKPFVTQEELRQENLILLSLGTTELSGKRADRVRKTLGGDAQHLKLVETTETIDMFVNSGIGYTLINGDLEYTYGYEQLAFLPIKGSAVRHYTWLISRKDNKKLILQRFLEYTDEIINTNF